ncbi:GyrI-like domain-containing protein [uncultured Maribacter sp.]|uniref:GyrI-like domain-containing protein n=1 Tax=uncultured Maribacter sp. TaxID=431308 RepID=UPI002617B3B7|nr:GyrI-like domain-containing protein [uncultured Maribacter sp.]
MKHEWRKKEKTTYLPKEKPELIDIPEYRFITLSGEGNPNGDFFAECIGVLYSVAYAIKMNIKTLKEKPMNYNDWTVYPLEGVWDISEKAKENFNGKINKDDLVFDLMIRQPNFINDTFFYEMLEFTKKKKPHRLLEKLRFEKVIEGKCIQMMHIGSYNNEPETFGIMENFAKNQGLIRESKIHREIYLTDFRKVPEDKLKTVLRFQLEN